MPTLEESMSSALQRRAQKSSLRSLALPTHTASSTPLVDFSSNDFLSLSTSPLLHTEYLSLLEAHLDPHTSKSSSTPPTLGSTGSRLLTGNSSLALTLEHDIAKFHNAPAGLLFNSGFDANSAFFSCVPQSGDVIVFDQEIHASVHEGMRTSRAEKRIAFTHNDVGSLRSVLEALLAEEDSKGEAKRNVFVAVESLYSMDGDICQLGSIVEAVEDVLGLGGEGRHGRGYIIIDEAHSTGIYGEQGRGLVCELGLEKKIFARLHTFGKALAANGAIILTTPLVCHYLLNYARPLIYSTSLSTPSLLLIKASYSILSSPSISSLSKQLHSLSRYLHILLSNLPSSSYITYHNQDAPSPIFSIQTPYPKELAKECQDQGFNVRGIMSPTVKRGTERVRVCLHAGNTRYEVEGLVRVIQEWIVDMEKKEHTGAITSRQFIQNSPRKSTGDGVLELRSEQPGILARSFGSGLIKRAKL
ncbi:8-amino-7-oxononanoate synthase protein [Rutstroemia sp. NJR-2017a BVV2]|nr:8-amino-7-oxononanoate synthase protein [Rutstroemia sp. NJR-2017a BVV2]